MASKPSTWTSGHVAAPNAGISGGRARGCEGEEHHLAEDTSRTSTSRGVRLKTEKQERQGRPGDDYFGRSYCGDQGHRGSGCRVRLEKLMGQELRGLVRISSSEDIVKAKISEILEEARTR